MGTPLPIPATNSCTGIVEKKKSASRVLIFPVSLLRVSMEVTARSPVVIDRTSWLSRILPPRS
jgi:hypothetical protein